jgi:hypothetical protein
MEPAIQAYSYTRADRSIFTRLTKSVSSGWHHVAPRNLLFTQLP